MLKASAKKIQSLLEENAETAPSLFVLKSANKWMEEAKLRPAPRMLFGEFSIHLLADFKTNRLGAVSAFFFQQRLYFLCGRFQHQLVVATQLRLA